MKDTSEIKVRLLLDAGDEVLRKFYFFKRKSNDFYWGSSNKSSHHTIPFKNTASVSFQIPEDLDKMEKIDSKFSFHESGVVHYKIFKNQQTDKLNIGQWCTLNDINKAKGFFAVISKEISNYEPFTKLKPTSGDSMPVIFRLPQIKSCSRLYFEFFLSPTPDISEVHPIIKIHDLRFHNVSIGINEGIYLIVRTSVISQPVKIPPNREIAFFIA